MFHNSERVKPRYAIKNLRFPYLGFIIEGNDGGRHMFEFIKERKTAAALDQIAKRLPRSLQVSSGVEKCAARAVANAYLLAGAEEYGREFAFAPMKLQPETVFSAVTSLAKAHRRKLSAADSLGGRPAHDPVFSAWKWEMLAIELVMATAGASIHVEARNAARAAWLGLKHVGQFSEDAVKTLQTYGKTYSIDPVPSVGGRKSDGSG